MTELSPTSTAAEVLAQLRNLASEENRQGMQRYGIRIERALGIPHGVQRAIARTIRRNHERAFKLWESGITEAQFIAALTADPKRFSAENARQWAATFDSWDIVDGVSDLFVETDTWRELIAEFAEDQREFVRRTAFAMMAWASVHRKREPDETFLGFLPVIERHATDGRNFVRKGVSWALRSIGKRSAALHAAALALAEKLSASTDKAARSTGRETIRDLNSPATQRRLAARARRS
jgi:3-methyladenine DNA glycosylase AlkD